MLEKNKGKNNIAEYIFNEYIFNRDLSSVSETLKNLDLLVENNLAIKITGEDDISYSRNFKFKVASYFMQKHNKKLRRSTRETAVLNRSGMSKYADDDQRLTELNQYMLSNGTYFADLKKDDYAVLIVSNPDPSDDYVIAYTLYLVGYHCNKWKDKYFKLISKYDEIRKESKSQLIYYTDGDTKVTRFKPFSQVIFRDKEKILKYIDNWVDKIPEYYKYGITPKLSILLYGKPGTGKSTFYKALAEYLKIREVCCISPSYFSTDDDESSTKRRRYSRRLLNTLYALDDIDCLCASREDNTSLDNGAVLSNLLAFLDTPDTFYFKAKDDIYYPISIVVATTNYIDRLDDAVKRYGRFDLKIEMVDFDKLEAEEMCSLYDLTLKDVDTKHDINDPNYTISPAYLQALCMEKIDSSFKKDK